MTIFKVPTLQTDTQIHKFAPSSLPCVLKWRREQLLVSLAQQDCQLELPALEDRQWLIECLKRSSVKLIRLTPALDTDRLQLWVDACEQAHKPVFLQIPNGHRLNSSKSHRSRWWFSQFFSRTISALLLLALTPVILGIIYLMQLEKPKPIFVQQWCVGERGKLFRSFKFRTTRLSNQKLEYGAIDEPTALGRWMRKYKLDELPQLFNVLRGEMSLIGPRPWSLYDAANLSAQEQTRLNALPGIITL